MVVQTEAKNIVCTLEYTQSSSTSIASRFTSFFANGKRKTVSNVFLYRKFLAFLENVNKLLNN